MYNIKVNTTNILLAALVAILIWQNFFNNKEVKEPAPISVTIPERSGSTGERVIERVITQPVYIPSTNQTVQVDSKWKELYEKAQDSLERTRLYLEAIKVRKYEKVLVDNDSIKVKGFATTRGSLLDYTIDYTIKPIEHTYKPTIIKTPPKLSLILGTDVGVPTLPNNNFSIRGNIGVINKKGNGVTFGYDNNKNVWLGVSKRIILKK